MSINSFKYVELLFLSFVLLGSQISFAQTNHNDSSLLSNNINPKKEFTGFVSKDSLIENNADDSVELALLNSETVYFDKPVHRKALFHFLRSGKLKKEKHDKRVLNRLYNRMANVFARMKIYPLAMEYFSKSMLGDSIENKNQIDGIEYPKLKGSFMANDSSELENPIPFANIELKTGSDSLFQSNISFSFSGSSNINSEIVDYSDIATSFHDGKIAKAYAVIIHVKQPIIGSRKAFAGLGDVGHTFVTLIKYNCDSSYVYHSFGFYPLKENILSATPLIPISTSVYKDDAFHDWDESIGKFISYHRFKKIERLIARYNKKLYHLNQNNCTDFGLAVANMAGVEIESTKGTWPLGNGNNPANTGQSIYEGKFLNMDTHNKEGLFICNITR